MGVYENFARKYGIREKDGDGRLYNWRWELIEHRGHPLTREGLEELDKDTLFTIQIELIREREMFKGSVFMRED